MRPISDLAAPAAGPRSATDAAVRVARIGAEVEPAVADLLAEVAAAEAGSSWHLVVDLGAVDRLDSPGLAALVRLRQQVRQRSGGWVCLAGPSRFVRTVLHVMRLEPAFPVFDDCESALGWLAAMSPGAEPGRG